MAEFQIRAEEPPVRPRVGGLAKQVREAAVGAPGKWFAVAEYKNVGSAGPRCAQLKNALGGDFEVVSRTVGKDAETTARVFVRYVPKVNDGANEGEKKKAE